MKRTGKHDRCYDCDKRLVPPVEYDYKPDTAPRQGDRYSLECWYCWNRRYQPDYMQD